MALLPFIADQDLELAVKHLLLIADSALQEAEKEFNKNVIDPFAAMFEMAGFKIDEETWRANEKTRKAQKSLQNHVGAFHQKILGQIAGWRDLGTGGILDLESTERKIIAEIKNKYNTISGGKLKDLYAELESLVMPKTSLYKGFTAYYVEIIPKAPERYDKPFTPSDKSMGSRKSENELIRKIDGYSFYGIVTGIDNALAMLFNALPEVIRKTGHSINGDYLKNFFTAAFGPPQICPV